MDGYLCQGCRQVYGDDLLASPYPGVVGAVDLGIRELKNVILPMVPGWREAMGQPLKGLTQHKGDPRLGIPDFEVEVIVRFKEREDDHAR